MELRTRAVFDCCKWDVQCEDHAVLGEFPLLLEARTAAYLESCAESLAREALAAERELLGRPKLLKRLGLPRKIGHLLRGSDREQSTDQLRVMRFDFHFTNQGWRISEVNADVPGGFIEASGWNALFGRLTPDSRIPPSPSEIYARAILNAAGEGGLVALIHATSYSDDRQVMQYLARHLKAVGIDSIAVSPEHVHWAAGHAEIRSRFASGRPNVLVRFFPAEWLPNVPGRGAWEPYFFGARVPVSNPGSALVIQSKRFPLIWDELESDLDNWRKLLPKTTEPWGMKSVLDDYSILKPALGRVGEGIGMPGVTEKQELLDIFIASRNHPREWVAQERFTAVPLATEKSAMHYCVGVFTIGGKAAGFYGRVAERPLIDQNAQDAAVLLLPVGGRSQ